MSVLSKLPLHIDREPLEKWYRLAEPWGCTCGDCRNFLALARQRRLPQPVLDALDELGIPPEKATYVSTLMPLEDGALYHFSYRIAGTYEREQSVPFDGGEARCCNDPYPYGAPGFPTPHFDLEFYLPLARVLPKDG